MSNLRGMPDSKKRLFIRSVEVCVSSGEGGVGKEGRLGGGRRSRGKRDGVTSEGGHALLKVSGAYVSIYIFPIERFQRGATFLRYTSIVPQNKQRYLSFQVVHQQICECVRLRF